MRNREPLTISLPRDMADAVRRASRREHRTTSEFVREALRRYLSGMPVVQVTTAELAAIQRGRAEVDRGDVVTLDGLRHVLGGPARQTGRAKTRRAAAKGSRPSR